jgi:hypothetical protein
MMLPANVSSIPALSPLATVRSHSVGPSPMRWPSLAWERHWSARRSAPSHRLWTPPGRFGPLWTTFWDEELNEPTGRGSELFEQSVDPSGNDDQLDERTEGRPRSASATEVEAGENAGSVAEASGQHVSMESAASSNDRTS